MDKKHKYLFYFLPIMTLLQVSMHTWANPFVHSPELQVADSVPPSPLKIDSLKKDTIPKDTTKQEKKKSESALNDIVNYQATDSLIFMGTNQAYLYGEGKVTYEKIELDANFIRMNMDSSMVYATGTPDSLGKLAGRPVFKQDQDQYESETMRYNFKTQKGYITNVVTQQGEGYVTGGQTKKMPNDEMYMTGCKYTTCDHHDHPHFYLNLTKAKVKPGKNIVTGPAYLVIEDVPLPLAVPFGFFPFSKTYSSGIIFPTFGDDSHKGFYLSNGGYYFALSDYMDLAVTGEIYSKGSWGLNAQSNYTKRYKYSGNFNLNYLVTILGDKGLPDYSKSKGFRVNWTHSQDQKVNPNMTFSSSVNFSTNSFDHNNFNSQYNPMQYTDNNKSSTINFSYNFPNSPFSLSSSFNINQNSRDTLLAVTFPDLNFNMTRIFPFKRKNPVGKERWYEKISLSYSMQLRNELQAKEYEFFKKNLAKDWRNGVKHNIPVSATFNLFKYLNITPSFNYNERWYTKKVDQQWDPLASAVRRDTTYGFNRVYDFNASMGLSTKLYGFFTPLPQLFGTKVEKIRHVLTPNVSFSWAPDFGAPGFGFWKTYEKIEKDGTKTPVIYSPYDGMLYGTAPRGKSGVVSFSLQNNLEMKVKSKKDSTGSKVVSLIDNFTAGISYNMAADSFNWSNINTQLRIKLTKEFTLNLNGTFDTYMYGVNGRGAPVRVNKLRIANGKGLGRLSSASTSFSYTISDKTFQKKSKENTPPPTGDDPNNNAEGTPPAQGKKKTSDDGYQPFSLPWSLSFNYSLGIGYDFQKFNPKSMEYKYKLNQNLSVSGNINLTQNWSMNMSTSWDFDQSKLAFMNLGITRNLHCWSMSANIVPVGNWKSYNFSIAVNSSLLKDLKYDKRGNSGEAIPWY